MSSPTIEQIIASPKLPSLPAVAVRIIDLVQQPDVSVDELASVVANDAALASKILRTANSSYYARARSVSKISDALVVLGLRRVKTLALGFSLVDDLRSRGNNASFDHSGFWQRSLFAAVAAREIARRQKFSLTEEAFLGGLTHSLGVLALNQALGDSYSRLFKEAAGDYQRLIHLERLHLGFDHGALGGALGEKWNLPPVLTASLRCVAAPDFAPAEFREIVRCVTLGALAADFLLGQEPATTLASYRERCASWFGISVDTGDEILSVITEDAAPMRALLDLPEGRSVSVGDLLAQANEALEQLSLEAELENSRLERERSSFALEAVTDPLTGLANRRRFDEFLEFQIRTAAATRTSVALLMVDIDFFKKINDTYGHQAGDSVLKALAATLKTTIRTDDLVARFGGEEFAVVLPSTPLRGAGVLGKRVREAIDAALMPIDDGREIHVTVSIGVAALAPRGNLDPSILIKAADQALYDAKHAGRNTVRLGTTETLAA